MFECVIEVMKNNMLKWSPFLPSLKIVLLVRLNVFFRKGLSESNISLKDMPSNWSAE